MIRTIQCMLIVSALTTLGFTQPPADPSPSPAGKGRPRLRDLGLAIGILPVGETNSIVDVAGVQVGHRTIIEGDTIRTGVTAIRPHPGNAFLEKTPAAIHVANGFGKFVGATQINELGVIETPIVLTNTLSTFIAADALVGWTLNQPGCEDVRSVNPVVGECNDGFLNDIRARRVGAKDVEAALAAASESKGNQPVAEGCVGAGVGVRCMGWKGGIGSSSRKLPAALGGYTLGVLVQTNFGGSLTIDGIPVGRELGQFYLKDAVKTQEHGSCIVVIATDAPLDSRRLGRLARRAPLGLAAAGSPISHGSGDYVLAFSTSPTLRAAYTSPNPTKSVELLRDDQLSPLFQAVRDATEEAVINSLLQAVTTTGQRGRRVEAMDMHSLMEVIRKHRPNAVADRTTAKSAARSYSQRPSEALSARIQQLDRRLPKWLADHQTPGAAVAIIENRQLVWSRGYGVRCAGTQQNVEPHTVMEACSMSKPFFAHLFLQLAQQGKTELTRSLVDYLGEDYIAEEPRHRRITAQMVLSHTTGLPNWRRGGWRSGGPLTLASEPGMRFRYSGEGFLMLQRAVEKHTGKSLDELSQQLLIQPLGLTHTRFVWDERLMASASCGHDAQGSLKPRRTYYDDANAAYTLYTTAEDYARFLVEMLREDRDASAGASRHTLSKELQTKMLTPVSHRDDQEADWGLGWGLRKRHGHTVAYHSGSNGTGFRCYSEFVPATGEGLVIMTNAIGGKGLWEQVVEQWHDDAATQ